MDNYSDKIKSILKTIKDFFFIIGPLATFIFYMSWLIIKDTDLYKKIDQTIEFGYEAKLHIIPKSDSLNLWQNNQIEELKEVIDKVRPEERTQFAIGLRYDTEKKQMFFRDINKDLKPVFKEYETGYYFYRDDNDIKRYVNY